MKRVKAFLVMVFALALGMFSGCYVVNGGKIDKIVGTYILDTYSRTYEAKDGEEEGEKHNYIEERNITEYLVITSDGSGYYIRKEGDEPIIACKMTYTFEYGGGEDGAADLIEYVSFAHSVTGQTKFGVNAKRLFHADTSLNRTQPNVFKRGYSDSYRYLRVSKKTDLSYVTKKLGSFDVAENFPETREETTEEESDVIIEE